VNRGANIWALILAAGEGSRLRSLTTTANGLAVPKQFCSLSGGPSLLQEAMRRASAVAQPTRICSVVARQHRCWWHGQLSSLPARNLVLQPENRGTAHGILLPLLHLFEQNPDDAVVLLPADHYVRDEAVLALSLQEAAALARNNPDEVFLLGVEPDAPDPELGYIVPAPPLRNGAMNVSKFVEKPALEIARTLLEQGALWNVFIIAASIRALLALYERRFADSLSRMRAAIALDRGDTRHAPAVAELYRRLASADFSRDVLEGQAQRLRAVPVRNCGWTDLGTPQRVAEALKSGRFDSPGGGAPSSTSLNLAAQHQRLQRARAECACLGVAS
jgi:mannose-1-phosphate guanylyltransferase